MCVEGGRGEGTWKEESFLSEPESVCVCVGGVIFFTAIAFQKEIQNKSSGAYLLSKCMFDVTIDIFFFLSFSGDFRRNLPFLK